MLDLLSALRDQRRFVAVTLTIGVARFLPGRVPGAVETWATILGLWCVGWIVVAWAGRGADAPEPMAAAVGAQNLAIQGLIAVPGIALGLGRMAAASEGPTPSAFFSNALGTLIILPLASLLVLSLAALPFAHALRAVLRRAAPVGS